MLKGRSLIEPDNFSLEETDALFALAEKIETDDQYSGWCAHRVEELVNNGKIIRPAYKSVSKQIPYTPLAGRQ